MATPNQLSTLNFSNNIVLNAIDKPDKEAFVYNLTGGYGILSYLVDLIAKQKSIEVTGIGGKHEIPLMGDDTVIAQIASVAQSGTSLVITLTNPNYDQSLFRINDIVLDVNRKRGRVSANSTPGQITIDTVPGQATLSSSTDFQAGNFVKSAWDATDNYSNTGKAPIWETPVYDYNYTAVSRESAAYSRRDMMNTWVQYQGKYWYSQTDQIALTKFVRARERKFWLSERGTSGANGYNQNGGLFWAIKDPIRGGYYQPMSNNPTQADFERFIMTTALRQASSFSTLTLLMGKGALANIQTNFTAPFVQSGGVHNTFGGSKVEGLNVMEYTLAGVKANIILVPFFDDPYFFPEASTIPGVIGSRMSNTIVAIDTGMYSSFGAGMQPAMKKIHWGSKETIYGYVPGLIGPNGAEPSSISQSGYSFSVNAGDTVSFQIYEDNGIDVVGYNMGLMELTA